MHKLILLFVACMCTNWMIAAAQEDTDIKANQQSQQEEKRKGHSLLILSKSFHIVSGVCVGIPMQIGKDIKKETYRMAGTLRQDMGNDFDVVANTLVLAGSVPYGILSGTILGTVHGSQAIANSLHTSSDNIPVVVKAAPPAN